MKRLGFFSVWSLAVVHSILFLICFLKTVGFSSRPRFRIDNARLSVFGILKLCPCIFYFHFRYAYLKDLDNPL